jgi:hypothetical protein
VGPPPPPPTISSPQRDSTFQFSYFASSDAEKKAEAKKAEITRKKSEGESNEQIEKEHSGEIDAVMSLDTPSATSATKPTAASTSGDNSSSSSQTGLSSLLSQNISSETPAIRSSSEITPPSPGGGATNLSTANIDPQTSSTTEKEVVGLSLGALSFSGDLPAGEINESLTPADQINDKNKNGESTGGKNKKERRKNKRNLDSSVSANPSQVMDEASSDENSDRVGKVHSPKAHTSPTKKRQPETSREK